MRSRILHFRSIGQLQEELGGFLAVQILPVGNHIELGLFRGRHIHFRAAVPDGPDQLDELFHPLLILRERQGRIIGRISGNHDAFGLVPRNGRQGRTDLLGDKGHEGMQQLQSLTKHIGNHILSDQVAPASFIGKAGFQQLDIPIAEFAPDKVVELGQCHPQFKSV